MANLRVIFIGQCARMAKNRATRLLAILLGACVVGALKNQLQIKEM